MHLISKISTLKEINKNCDVGIDGIDFVLEKVKDSDLKEELLKEKQEYNNLYKRSFSSLIELDSKPETTPPVQKAMSWIGVQLSTLPNPSNTKIAEILIQGNDMGIVTGNKLLNNTVATDNNTISLIKDFISMQENNVQKLKKFL